MRNKRTLRRGLALLMAGGMALSNLSAVPVLAEEYDTATEIVKTEPEVEQATPETAAEETAEEVQEEAADTVDAEVTTPQTESEVELQAANEGDATPVAQSNPWDDLEAKTNSRVDIDNPAYSRTTVLEVGGKPFWYNGIQVRIDKLKDDPNYACTDAELEKLYGIAARDGYTVVNSQIRWTDVQPNHIAYATDSAYVYGGGNADTNFANGNAGNYGVQVQNSDKPGSQALTYLKFTINDKTAEEIDGAKIRVYSKKALNNSHKLEIYALADDSWSQDTLTWNNAPGHNGYAVTGDNVQLVATSNSWDLMKGVNYYDFNVSDFIKTSDWAKDGTVSFIIREADDGVKNEGVKLGCTMDTDQVGTTLIQPQLVYSDAEEYDFTVLDNAIHWATENGLKFEVLWFGTDTCTISSDSRIPVHAQLNYQWTLGNDKKPLFSKSSANSVTGVYNYIMCKNDTGLQAAESTALATVFNHIATLPDTDTVIGCQLTNEPGVGRLHGGKKAEHCMCDICLDDKAALGMGDTDFRNYTLWNYNNILGAAVKGSKHSVWTRINLDEGSNSTGIVKYNEDVRSTTGTNIDFIGIDHYRKTPAQLATEGVAGNTFAQGKNLTMMMELGQKDARESGLYLAEDVLATLSGGAYVTIYDASSGDGCEIYAYNKATKEFTPTRGSKETGTEAVVAALAKTNNMLKKIGYDLATKQPQAAGGNQLVYFNATSEATDAYEQQETMGNKLITFKTQNNGVGIAVNKNDNEIALLSTKGDTFTFDNATLANVVSAELGYYDADDVWHSEQDYLSSLTEADGKVALTVPAYDCVRIVTKENSLAPVFQTAQLTVEAESGYTLSEGTTAAIYADGKNGKNSQYLHVTVTKVGEYAELTVDVPYDGIYRADACYKVYSNRPTVQLTADGKDVGAPVDMTKGTSKKWITTTFGEVALTKGTHTFRFTVTALNTASDVIPLDFLYLERVGDLVDYSELQALYDQYVNTANDDYTDASWNALQEALQNAKAMLDAQSATASEAAAQYTLLKNAFEGLEINTDKDKATLYKELKALLNEAEQEKTKTDRYTADNIQKLDAAIADAQTILADENDPAVTNNKVATILKKFQTAYNAFKATAQLPPVDKTALQKAVDDNADKQETDYTADSWAAYTKALKAAQDVLADENASQADIDAATQALSDAAAALKAKADEPTESPKPSEQPTAAPTTKPSDSNSSNSSNNSTATATPKPTAAPKATEAPKATAAPAAVIPQTADAFPLVLLTALALCSVTALVGLTVYRKKKF